MKDWQVERYSYQILENIAQECTNPNAYKVQADHLNEWSGQV